MYKQEHSWIEYCAARAEYLNEYQAKFILDMQNMMVADVDPDNGERYWLTKNQRNKLIETVEAVGALHGV